MEVRGARQHNLKNIDVDIPKNCLVVITGPSGSGKSSLAFDTIYAEGQRRYVDSLSSYARQFLGVQDKPDVDDISGLSPAISIEQKGVSHNPRSTVGTVTEVYDYLRLLFGRTGTPVCPQCGKPVERHTVDEILEMLLQKHEGEKVDILSPVARGKKGEFRNLFLQYQKEGFLRARVDGTFLWLEEDIPLDKNKKHNIEVFIDRLTVDGSRRDRLAEAVENSLSLSGGYLMLAFGDQEVVITEKFACPECDMILPEIEPRLFSFNNPFGACPDCNGLGSHQYLSEELAVDPCGNVLNGALLPWKNRHYMLRKLAALARHRSWSLDPPFRDLPDEVREAIIHGDSTRVPLTYREGNREMSYMGRYEGLIPWLETRWKETDSESIINELAGYRAEDVCQTCKGKRLRPEALSVRVDGLTIGEVVEMPVSDLLERIGEPGFQILMKEPARRIIEEIAKRLSFMVDVGVGYLSLSRRADTLSSGESQRIRLATQIGSKLSGVLYVLDEPTIGLHPRDTTRLLGTLEAIRDLDNTVLVVEHDRDTMTRADYIVALGPGAGEHGGMITACGKPSEIVSGNSLSGPFISGQDSGTSFRRGELPDAPGWIVVKGAEENNLKSIDVSIPLGRLVCISGVSGSGKSTLLNEVLYKGLKRKLDKNFRGRAGQHRDIEGWEALRNVVMIDQTPIGRTPRSNPATYTQLFTPIRELFASLPESRIRGYKAGRFSFNVRGGRCEACKGDGEVRISMLFMPDVYVKCEVCHGKRYNRETLDIRYKDKNIAEVLEMSVDEARAFFGDIPRISRRLSVLQQAGLGYIRLGQPATTLSGGEAQRVKLAEELGKQFRGHTLYILDEPTTGLHYLDVRKLLVLLQKIIDQGNTVLLIEHNLDVLASADHIIDLGPEGGHQGGTVVATGSPDEIVRNAKGHTARHLGEFLDSIKRREADVS
ncbi:MAG: excinuclease ABC subunit UvrA [Synergistales bacterium]|nr:excinuclease ABC subunit UvrA [Synergistales bacterium]